MKNEYYLTMLNVCSMYSRMSECKVEKTATIILLIKITSSFTGLIQFLKKEHTVTFF